MADGFFNLIRPEVPDAQHNKAPEILLEGMRTGLQAAAQFAQMRRQSESEVLRLASQERIAHDEHELKKQQIEQGFEIAQATLDSTRTLNEAHADYYTAGAKAYAEGTKTAAQRAIAFNQQRQELVTDVNDQATRLQLDDPKFATNEPVKFAANVMQFEDMFRLSPLPEVKNAIAQYRRTADQQKINLRTGVTDETGELKASGEGRQVPIWQVVKNLQDPLTQDQTMNDLTASGHVKIVDEFQDFSGKKVPVKKTEPSPLIKSYLDKGKDVKFEHVPSRVPAAMLPKSAAGGTAPTEMPLDIPPDTTTDPVTDPQASAQPKFEPTETDKMIGMAKAALAKGAPPAAVTQKLQELGIDPAQLWAA